MIKKFSILLVAITASMLTAQAGGLMTNTNYHVVFDRMMARGATFDIDAAYSNRFPAVNRFPETLAIPRHRTDHAGW